MSLFAPILGQRVAIEILERALDVDRVASAYLFEGPAGVGKELTALTLAKALVAAEDEKQCARIEASTHPDVRIFRPRDEGKRNIQVEFLRSEILPYTQYAPFEAKHAVIIFPEADVAFPSHPPETANALLKTLEEPRPGVHFILLSERPDRLLPTIRSRCQRLKFGRLPSPVLERILDAQSVENEGREAAIALSDGRADRALALIAMGADTLFENAMRIDNALAEGKPGSLIREAERIAKGDEGVGPSLETLITYYRDISAAALGVDDEHLRFQQHAARIRERATGLGAARAAQRVETIQEALRALERNANVELTLDALFYEMRG